MDKRRVSAKGLVRVTLPKVLLRSLLFVGLCAVALSWAQPAKAIVILSNLSAATAFNFGGTNLGFSPVIDRAKAVGLTVGADNLSFTSLTGRFSNEDSVARSLTGGIFSDVGGNPGVQLVAFNPASVPSGSEGLEVALTATSPFTLLANTSYWFLLDGPDVENSLLWTSSVFGTAPTPSAEVASYNGYRLSGDGGTNWIGSSTLNIVQIEASLGTATAVLPEPGTLAVFGLGLVGLGIARRRLRAQA